MSLNVDSVVNQLKLKDKVLIFLDKKSFLKELELCFTSFSRNSTGHPSYEPFFANLNLRFGEIEDAEILYLVMKEPNTFVSLTENVVFCLFTLFIRESGINFSISQEQIHCIIRFYDLPQIKTYKFTRKSVHINCALTTFHCVIVSKSTPEQYIQQSLWKCQKCFGLAPVIRRNQESRKLSLPCEACLENCVEILESRKVSKFCSLQVLEVEFKDLAFASRLEVRLYDDLCQDLKLGSEYNVVGTFEPFHNYFKAWSIFLSTDSI